MRHVLVCDVSRDGEGDLFLANNTCASVSLKLSALLKSELTEAISRQPHRCSRESAPPEVTVKR